MKSFQAVATAVLMGGMIVVAASCGSAGSTGPTGATGATGPAGPQGPEGNANVLADTFTVTNSQWLFNSQYSLETSPGSYTEYFTRYYDATDSSITSDILTSGMVLVYFVPNPLVSTTQWEPLPYSFEDGSANFSYNYAYETSVDQVELEFFFAPNNPTASIPTLSTFTIPSHQFKIVAVGGSIAEGMTAAHVDTRDYAAVMQYISKRRN
jgi:hypothetical protein